MTKVVKCVPGPISLDMIVNKHLKAHKFHSQYRSPFYSFTNLISCLNLLNYLIEVNNQLLNVLLVQQPTVHAQMQHTHVLKTMLKCKFHLPEQMENTRAR